VFHRNIAFNTSIDEGLQKRCRIFPEIFSKRPWQKNKHITEYRNIAIDMGTTKTEIFTEKQNKLAMMMKALGHPARIAILQHLIKARTCICGDLVEELGLAQATVSQHLKELKNVGLIKGTIEGTSVCYCIDGKVWNQFKAVFESFFITYVAKDECC
jgi:DNA-binding transcriptional ArsR family regulator